MENVTVLNSIPAIFRMTKSFRTFQTKLSIFRLPLESLHGDVWPVNAQHVEGVFFTTAASGGGRPGLNNQRRVSLNFVTRGGVCRVADVQVPGEKKIGVAARQCFHGHPRPSH